MPALPVKGATALVLAVLVAIGGLITPNLPLTSNAHAMSTTLWSASHEAGTTGEWTSGWGGAVNSDGTGTLGVSTDQAHSGLFSAKLSITNASGIEQGAHLHRWAESATQPEAYYSAWFYFPQRYSGMSWWNIFQWQSRLSSEKTIPLWILNIGNTSDGSMYFYLYDWVARKSYRQSAATIPTGKWVHLEAFYRQSSDATGQIVFWQDGTEIIRVSDVTTRRHGDEIQWSVNNYTDQISPADATIYVDDAAVSTTRLGPDYPASVTPSPTTGVPRSTNYYVDSEEGLDSNDGATPATPWKSLAKVSATPFAPGDTIHFKRGGSWQGTLTITSSGTEGSPITVQAYGNGPSPEIFSERSRNTRTVVLYGNYIVFKEFRLRDAHEAGVEVGGSYNTVRDNEVYATGWGVRLLGQNNKIINNYVHDLLMIVDDPAYDNDYGAAGVVIWGGADSSEIAYNRFFRCRAPSHDYGTDGGVVEFWETSRGHRIHHNESSENNGVFEVGGGTVSDVVVHDNVFYNDFGGYAGIHWGGHFAAAVEDFRIENNTIVQQRQGSTIFASWGGTAPDAGRVVVRNNIIATQQRVFADDRFTHTGNVYYLTGKGNLGPGVSIGSGERLADPRFVDLENGDLRLLAESPALGVGPSPGFAAAFLSEPTPVEPSPRTTAPEPSNGSISDDMLVLLPES